MWPLTQTGHPEVDAAPAPWPVGHVKLEAESHQQPGDASVTIAQQTVGEVAGQTGAGAVQR